jgi:electron transfer flavoprotein alpha subunit
LSKVLAIAEQRDGALRKISYEVVTAARGIAETLGASAEAAVLGGAGTSSLAADLAKYGAATVHVAEHDAFASYSPDGYASALAELIRGGDYFAVLFPASALGKDLAPRVAAQLDLPLATDVTGLAVENGELVITRPVYAGRLFSKLVLEGGTRLVSLRPNVFRASESAAAGAVEQLVVQGSPDAWRVKVREVKAAPGGKLDVGEAPIVVSGGRGMKGPEHWHLLESLRDALGGSAALGASRAVVDAGWRPHAEQVGQTGKTVSPQLYIAVAISGAMQHLAGMRSAATIVAINKDADAPIFKVADYGLVGDVTELLPRITEEIRRVRGG